MKRFLDRLITFIVASVVAAGLAFYMSSQTDWDRIEPIPVVAGEQLTWDENWNDMVASVRISPNGDDPRSARAVGWQRNMYAARWPDGKLVLVILCRDQFGRKAVIEVAVPPNKLSGLSAQR